MADRRTAILDAALHVLAEDGMRGLTHRAADAAAGLPAGSTSYYFRTRAALVAGCLARLLDLDLEHEPPAAGAAATGPAAFADALTEFGVHLATTQRHRTLARYELALASARDPDLRAALVAGGDTLRGLGARILARLGAPDPVAAAEEVAAVLDGLLFTALVRGPDDPAALAGRIRPAMHRVVAGVLTGP